MKQFEAQVSWQRAGQAFLDGRYSRAHDWQFDGGLRVPASSSPLSVPVPMSDPAAVDPEEALVAAASSCHMLFFLSIAGQRGFTVDSYVDRAVGFLDKDSEGRMAMTRIELRPAIVFDGEVQPTSTELDEVHHLAHERCYVANSLKTEVVVVGGS
ncbi:OsmC family protein [Telluria aromaticivorans]|uniref:OsmC family protein n=1 Tax=Telluria aromaticivorans TaxID=2725995 RepID=A0A7Y2JZG9_9BURK|nr:OsmC family protein [Telluria aromaticivorans]NNG23867.1 OsmC family protein [Telluria aromaticivorans]